jgi:cell division protease FtsH
MIFLGRDIGEQKDYSEHVGEMIDDEIRRIIDDGYARATSILHQHRDLPDRLARARQRNPGRVALEHIFQTA